MKITKVRDVKTPTRGTERSAGLDFYVPAGVRVLMLPNDDVLIPSGIKVEVPHGYALIAQYSNIHACAEARWLRRQA